MRGVGVRRTWVRGVVGYARTEANMSKGTEDNGAEDRGSDQDGDRDALNGGKVGERSPPLMVLLRSSRGC
jgi:hypothetical protein